jgi:hypothetical protein
MMTGLETGGDHAIDNSTHSVEESAVESGKQMHGVLVIVAT